MVEAKHRMRLLERIGYWKLRGAEWSQVRAFYAAIIAGIESDEFSWDVPFADIESMIIDKPLVSAAIKPDKKGVSKPTKKTEGTWFCRDYNSEKWVCVGVGPQHNYSQRGYKTCSAHLCQMLEDQKD